MKNIFLAVTFFSSIITTTWQPSFEKAQQLAKQKHQLILLNFSGSDWCGPCMRMHKEIFASDAFTKMADTSLISVNADFPRKKKNQLEKSIQQQNDALAERYNPQGKFPYTVIINENGKVVKAWDGLPKLKPEEFAKQVKAICDANKK